MLKKLGPYHLERLLGRGGMGSVYVGIHEVTGERAAIKVLAITLADDPNFRARFMSEIETLKQLRHPNIVQLFGDGEQDGQLFYVMELVEGQSLQEILQAGHTFDWRETTKIAIDVCSALKHAHDSGVIHRDLKPANLLCTLDDKIKLTDFGIAKLFGATHRTADGSVVGTADYMAPEQADSRPVTNRTDLYSLGAVMFTLLARRTPFQGGSLPQVIHRLKYEEAPSLRRYAPNVPEELDQIIGELLRKDPQQRVATAIVLANRLRAMEHALLARANATAMQSGVSDELGDRATAAETPQAAPHTKMGPTFADQPQPEKGREFSWNEATIVTSSSRPKADKTDVKPSSHKTIVDDAPRRDRFTSIEEDQQRRVDSRKQEEREESGSSFRSMAGIIALILVLVAVCIYGLMPISADKLYARIISVSNAKTPSDAWNDIEQFLKRFPDDARFQEVDNLRMEVECDSLASRLRIRKRKTEGYGLEEYEDRWLEAFMSRHKEPEKAKQTFQAIVTEYGSAENPPKPLRDVLAAAKYQLQHPSH